MASNQTEHYGLPQWDFDDRILMDEFNGAMATVDTALHAKAEVKFGTYKGDGAEERFIDLGATPKAVLLVREDGVMSYWDIKFYAYGALALAGTDVIVKDMPVLKIVDGGFTVHQSSYGDYFVYTNKSTHNYNYIAFF